MLLYFNGPDTFDLRPGAVNYVDPNGFYLWRPLNDDPCPPWVLSLIVVLPIRGCGN